MRRVVWVSVALTVLAAGACSGDGNGIAMAAGQRFDPAETSVPSGATITFTNETDEAHTVTAYEEGLPAGTAYFSSGGAGDEDSARDSLSDELIRAGESFELTLDSPGTYRYFCIAHEDSGMKGTIVVEE